MVDKKYLKDPLGEDEKGKKKRLKDEEKRKKVDKRIDLVLNFNRIVHMNA